MNYKVLYRKYRPKKFDDFVGQEYIIKTLKNAIINNKCAHAYIFTGPRGTGKTTTAKVFAKAINCEENIEGNPCGKCNSCTNIDANADIIEMDAASNNGVEEIREIINNIRLTPSYSKYKVYIIDEVHMLSQSAFNALLLTLEEPPPHVIFILATTEIQSVPITVLSRCQRHDFKLFSLQELVNHLKRLANEEKIEITDDALTEIAHIAEGGMRDALSIFDQLIGRENLEITLGDVVNVFGTISTKSIQELINHMENGSVEKIVNYMDNISAAGTNFKSFVDKLVFEIKEKAIELKVYRQKSNLDYHQLKKLTVELSECQLNVKSSVNVYSVITLIILDYIDVDSNSEIEIASPEKTPEIAEEIKVEEASVIAEEEPPKKPKEKIPEDKKTNFAEEIVQIRINNCFVDAKRDFLKKTQEEWSAFIKDIKKTNKKLLSLVIECEIVAASDKYVILTSDSESNANLVNDSSGDLTISFKDFTKEDYVFVCITKDIWKKEKEKYIENIKNGYKYELLEEKEIKSEINETKNLAKDIFGEKLEIK